MLGSFEFGSFGFLDVALRVWHFWLHLRRLLRCPSEGARLKHQALRYRSFRKLFIGVPDFGVLIIRILLFGVRAQQETEANQEAPAKVWPKSCKSCIQTSMQARLWAWF